VQAAVDPGVSVRQPRLGVRYLVAADPSGGRGDAFTAAVGHAEGATLIIDRVYERRAPFVSDVAMDEVAAVARDYGAATVLGDDYGADLTVSAFRGRGIAYKPITIYDKGKEIKLNRSEIYLNALPLFTAGRVRLPDNPRLFNQLISLSAAPSAPVTTPSITRAGSMTTSPMRYARASWRWRVPSSGWSSTRKRLPSPAPAPGSALAD
jgi:hypothetical protein